MAFVAPPKSAPALAADEGDAVINSLPAGTRVSSRFHATNAVAKMPYAITPAGKHLWPPTLAPEKRRKDGARGARGTTPATSDETARMTGAPWTGLRQEVQARQVESFATGTNGQQFVVLTTWEQVEAIGTRAARNENETDEASKSTAQAASAAEAPAQMAPATRRFTVTRLIMRVYPVGSINSRPVNPGAARPGTGSRSMPAFAQQVIPLRDGWLVIQL